MTEPGPSILDGDPTAEPELAARPRRRLRDRWLLLTVLSVLGVALLAVAVIVGWYGKSVLDGLDGINRNPDFSPTYQPDEGRRPDPVQPKPGEKNSPLNIVLMGADARNPDERGRSDVLMVLHIPGNRQKAYLISLPRDYWVPIPGRKTAKINAAYSWGGPSLTVKTVEQLLKVPVNHTVSIDFENFTRVIDALGGVTVVNRHASSVGTTQFPAGQITLHGEDALQFVRQRKGLPNGDFDRAERQRDVIKGVVGKLMSVGTLADPIKFRSAVTSLGPNFTVDPGFTNQAIIDLGMQMRIKGGQDIVSMVAPSAGFGWSQDKQSYVKVDEQKLAALAAALRADAMDAFSANN